jgi:anhydro-N-acetylmuramic acid kinase
MTKRYLIGLSSGSTVDGVDAVLLEADGVGLGLRLRFLHGLHHSYPRDLRDLIQRASAAHCSVREVSLLHRLLGETFALAARQVADQARFSLHRAQSIGCPGHTLAHETEGRYPSTLGLGMAGVVAERTGLTVASDFRCRDLAVGGHGLALTALVDALLFQHPIESTALINLGSITTVVYLPAGPSPRGILGFHAGPCNLLLDRLMARLTGGRETYDAWGKHAVQGKCLEPLLQRWLAHPWLQRRPPRSLPANEFGEEFLDQALAQARDHHGSLHDLLCTATHLAAAAVGLAMRRFLPAPQRILFSGGGVHNGFLRQLVEHQLAGIPAQTVEQFGIPVRARKAIGFGGLAALLLDGVPANLMSVTGASGTRLLGSLTPGAPANWSRCLAWMASQATTLTAA